jgi:hypothetical protein
MRRLKKAMLLPTRRLAYRWNLLPLYYWAERELFELRSIDVMPEFYYRWLFRFSMRIVHIDRFQRLAEKLIHTIPYHVRFNMA